MWVAKERDENQRTGNNIKAAGGVGMEGGGAIRTVSKSSSWFIESY